MIYIDIPYFSCFSVLWVVYLVTDAIYYIIYTFFRLIFGLVLLSVLVWCCRFVPLPGPFLPLLVGWSFLLRLVF